MSVYEVFRAVCDVVLVVCACRMLWLFSESQMNAEEYLKQIADELKHGGHEPGRGCPDADPDGVEQLGTAPVGNVPRPAHVPMSSTQHADDSTERFTYGDSDGERG